MKKLRLIWLLIVVCALSPAPSARGQGDDVLSRESDEGVANGEERRQALATLTAAARRSLDAGESASAARLLNRAGRLQLMLNRQEESLAVYREALSALGPSTDGAARVDSLNGMAAAHAQLSQCGSARRLVRRAVALSKEAGYVAGRAEALLTLSECLDASDHTLALRTAQESLALWQSAGSRLGVARAMTAIGGYQLALNDLAESEHSSRAALEIWRELGLRGEEAEPLINLGFVEYRRGAWQDSLWLLAQAEGLLDPKSEPYRLGQITGGMGEAFIETGMHEAGLVKLRESLEYFRQAKRPVGVAVLTWDIGKTLHLMGDHPAAFDALRRALADAESLEELPLVAMCHEYLGRAYAATGDRDAALEHFHSALNLHGRVGNRMEAARTVALMGRVYQQEGRLKKARRLYKRALATFRRLSDHVDEAATLYALGSLELERGDTEAAEVSLRQSIEVTQSVRRGSSSTDLAAAFSAAVHERSEKYVECLMRMHASDPSRGLDALAFESSESARARSLSELLRATATSLVPGLDRQLAEQERSLRQAIRVKEDARMALLGGKYERSELEELKAELSRLSAEYERVEETIRVRHPGYGQIVRPAGWNLRRIRDQVIDDETVLLAYSLGAERSYGWAVTRGGLVSYELPPRQLVERAAERVYKLLSEGLGRGDKEELEAAVRELGGMILTPAAAVLRGKSRVVVIADGALNYVPFLLLPVSAEGDEPLIATREVVNAPSASVLGQLREEAGRRAPPAKTLAAFGDPVFASNYAMRKGEGRGVDLAVVQKMEGEDLRSNLRDITPTGDSPNPATIRPLTFAGLELENLRKVVGDSFVAADFDATRDRLQATDLSEFAILHFATHGFLDPKSPEKSGLMLSTVDREGGAREGFVGLRDVYNLRAPVELVVLSACRTALGKDVRGEGMIGLTRGFLYAGASSVVSSLWKVDDEATSELMRRFYDNMLRRGMTPAAALRAAQNSIRQEPQWRSPYYWAAFTLQGDYRRVLRPAPAPGAALYTKALAPGGALLLLSLAACAAWRLRRRRARLTPSVG
jgi:CHAT domain-containing protein